VKDHVTGRLVGSTRMDGELEARLFGANSSGEVLHRLSFQRSLGTNGWSSNAKERYSRYVASCPCKGFDPVIEFGLRKHWSHVALRMVRIAHTMRPSPGILARSHLSLLLRGEGLRFRNLHKNANDSHYYKPLAAMQWIDDGDDNGPVADKPKCEYHPLSMSCTPAHSCETSWGGLNGCKVKTEWSGSGWWTVDDSQLQKVVAPVVSSGSVSQDNLFGLEMHLYCAPKREFGVKGPPSTHPTSLKACLDAGVLTNARLKAASPWKLYFPDEVVVVAQFKEIVGRRCLLSGNADDVADKALCKDATVDDTLGNHVDIDLTKSSDNRKYMGMHTGAGFPKATLEEVILKPEDILEILELIPASNSR